jgi:seryl-tRNA synthetase
VDEINRMELNSRNLQQENEGLRRRINETESSYGTELKNKITSYEQRAIEMNRRMQEYENKIAMLSQEVERLNIALRTKAEAATVIEQRNRGLQQEL